MRRFLVILSLVLPAFAPEAHEMRPAYLEITETSSGVYDVLWKVPARGDNLRLAIYVKFAEDVELIAEPVGGLVGGAHVERWRVRRAGGLAGTRVVLKGLASTYTDALVKVSLLDLQPQSILLGPEKPFLTVAVRPSGKEIAGTYLRLGVEHILLGVDHLLFVLGLMLLVDRRWMLVKTITAFTVAHSMTLALSTFAILRVPTPPLNAAIALSILFLGPEIVRQWRGETSLTIRHPWVVAFAFGLLHGVGFASGLSLTGVPRPEIPFALLFFNLGVEAGQLAFVCLALSAALAMRTLELDRSRLVTRIPGYAVGCLGAYWTIQRVVLLFFAPQMNPI
jgi:hydrogenase/urease accessory protein HupE